MPSRHAQLVLGLPLVDLQLRNRGLGLLQGACGLIQVQFGLAEARLVALLDELQHLALQGRVGLQQGDPLLVGANLHVIDGHVAQQRDQHVVVVGHGGVQIVVGRGNRPAEPPPEIEFPTEGEAIVPLVHVGRGGIVVDPPIIAKGVLLLGKDFAHRHLTQRSGLKHAEARLLQRQVLSIRTVHQIVELGILEDRPPVLLDVRIIVAAEVGLVDPVLGHGGRGLAVVGAHLEAVVDVVVDARAAARRTYESQHCRQNEKRWMRRSAHFGSPCYDWTFLSQSAEPIRPEQSKYAMEPCASTQTAHLYAHSYPAFLTIRGKSPTAYLFSRRACTPRLPCESATTTRRTSSPAKLG